MAKLYVMTDYEGVAGIDDWDNRRDNTDVFADSRRLRHRRLLTGEVNAAVEGALDAGYDEILVNDCHGGGRTILYEEIHPSCRLLRGAKRATWLYGLDDTYDACIFVGAHAMAGSGGCLQHTFSLSVAEWRLNGVAIGEIGGTAAIAGAWGVPLVAVTGGAAACREAEALVPGIATAAIKEDVSETAAIHMPFPEARGLIRERVAAALSEGGAISKVAPLTFEAPFIFRKALKEPSFTAEIAREGLKFIDERVIEYSGDNALAVLKDAIY